jgi:branched-chain amino acid transport system ATP-binding protein
MSLLSVKNLTKRFGGVTAVDAVSFDLDEGMIKGLIGPNGAGKSTLFNCISGFESYDEGTVRFGRAGDVLKNGDRASALRAGITRTFQTPALFDDMTVRENLLVPLVAAHASQFLAAGLSGLLPRGTKRLKNAHTEADRVMDAFEIKPWADAQASDLPAGTRRIVELVRACCAGSVDALSYRLKGGSAPRLLLLDEPAAGLNPSETAHLAEHIRRVRNMGITVLLVEHDLSLVMGLCDEILVLDYGKKIAEGAPRLIQKNEAVIEAYLGTAKNG